jgi:hypothetical protein
MMTLAIGVSLLIACGDSGNSGPPKTLCESSFVGSPSCFIPNFEEEVLRPKLEGCAGDPSAGSCHVKGTAQSTMELDVTDPSTSVEGELAALIGQNGLGGEIIDPSCIDSSFLLTKLTANPGGGSRMPLGSAPWSNDEIECFRAYLTDMFALPEEEQ